MIITEQTQAVIEGKKNFWFSERIIFLTTIVSFFLFAIMLLYTEKENSGVIHHTFLDFLFDTVSVGTLTGLFRGDSGTFTFSGQFILLLDMVVNGLIASVISILLIVFVRLGFDKKETLRGELEKLGLHSKSILLFIFLDFLFIWTIGTLLFLGSGAKTVWESIFNSASHILNNGVTAFPNNMVPFKENIAMLLSGMFLITIGGLGISIRGYFYKLCLQTLGLKKLAHAIPNSVLAPKNFIIAVVAVTAILQIFGAITMYNFESHNAKVFENRTNPAMKLLNTYYMSVSARTAGFTTMPDLSLLHDKSAFILMLLMTVGASSGSFAGGIIKLTAFLYIFIYIIARIRGDSEIKTPHQYIHFSERTIIEANFRIIGFTIIVFFLTLLLFFVQPDISGLFLAFESISGVSNTGLTLGATNILNSYGMIIIILLMTIGKLGFITTIISFFPKYQNLIGKAQHQFDEFPVD